MIATSLLKGTIPDTENTGRYRTANQEFVMTKRPRNRTDIAPAGAKINDIGTQRARWPTVDI